MTVEVLIRIKKEGPPPGSPEAIALIKAATDNFSAVSHQVKPRHKSQTGNIKSISVLS